MSTMRSPESLAGKYTLMRQEFYQTATSIYLYFEKDLASWLQAFAALVALVISVCTFIYTQRHDRRRQEAQAAGIAVSIYPALCRLEVTISTRTENLKKIVAERKDLVGQSVAGEIALQRIDIESMLERNIDSLYLLKGDLSQSTITLINLIFHFNDRLHFISQRIGILGASEWTILMKGILEILKKMSRQNAGCLANLERFLNLPVNSSKQENL